MKKSDKFMLLNVLVGMIEHPEYRNTLGFVILIVLSILSQLVVFGGIVLLLYITY